jgi:hypothetical protein
MIRVLAIIAASVFAFLPLAAIAHGGTEVSVKGDVRADGPIEIVGADFAANDVVRIELRREGTQPIELGRIPADGAGTITATLHVPASVRAGLYQIAADGQDSATAEVTILAATSEITDAPAQPASANAIENQRPAGETIGLAVFTAIVAVVAVGLLWVSRTHARTAGTNREGGTT